MLRLCKKLLLWLLLAVLPVQGIATAAMLSCGSAERASAEAHAHDVARASAAADHAMHVHHAHAALAADMSATNHAAHYIAMHDGDHHSHGKHSPSSSCSACAACCIGAAPLPAGVNWAMARNGSEAVLVSPSPLMTGFIPASPERPPRSISA
jgi:hypothetical protein